MQNKLDKFYACKSRDARMPRKKKLAQHSQSGSFQNRSLLPNYALTLSFPSEINTVINHQGAALP
jgi:hypothetical protein